MDFDDKNSFFIVTRQIVNTNINNNCLLNCEISHEVENIILPQGKQKSMPTYLVKIGPQAMEQVLQYQLSLMDTDK
jgi:hypothetical protein